MIKYFQLIIFFLLPILTFAQSDNIIESDCNAPLESFEWGIREDWSSNDNIFCRINPLIGDLDDDGIPEIVCFDMKDNSSSETAAKIINVYDGQSKSLKAQITIEGMVWAHGNGPYGLVKLPDRKGLIITACKDTKLYAYDISSANPSHPVWISNNSYNTGYNDFSVSLGFADFNNDGHPEVYVRNKIFDAETGILLATAQGGYNQADSYSHNSHSNHNKLSCPLAFDICGDTRQELILGNEIYDVVITNRNGTSGNHATLTKSVIPPNWIINDGHVQVADFNLDGHPDILISNRDTESYYGTVSLYVWDVFNNRTSQPIQLSTNFSGKSVPLIADFDNDNYLEVLIDCCASEGPGLRAYRFVPSGNYFNHLWTLAIDEDSYSNTATLFDFNNDGKNELVFTDNSRLHVFDLSTNPPTELSNIDCGEISIMQVPIVADVDNDGSAEILVTGKENGYMQANTMLKIYKSSTEPWRAVRKVWNQYMYHVTNVNEDLTIPSLCFNTANVFTGTDGVIRRPYNNFLQQAGYITPSGEPYHPADQIETSFSITTCQPYTWNDTTYSETGVYQQTFTTGQGCDSIVTLNLTMKALYNASPIYGDTLIYYKNTGLYTYYIDPVEGAFGYDWTLDGPWALSSSPDSPECVVNITSEGTGTLHVRVYTECGFIERSVRIKHSNEPGVTLFPNPTKIDFNIALDGMQGTTIIVIQDYLGQIIDRFIVEANLHGTLIPYTLRHKAAGVYLVTIINNYQSFTKKITKETPADYRAPRP